MDLIKNFITDVRELTRTERVDAVSTGKEFYTIDGNLNTRLAGYTELQDFNNGAAKGLVFIEKGTNKTYSLGNPNKKQTQHLMVDHPRVIQPILEAGFDLKTASHTRGGSSLCAIFEHPEISIPDTISWDEENYPGKDGGQLNLSLAAFLDARTGKSLRFTGGYLRVLCTNGLTASILNMGSLRLTHNQFTANRVNQFAQDVIGRGHVEQETFSPRVLDFPLRALDQFQRNPDATLATMPNFVSKPFMTSLGNLSNYNQDSMLYQMNMAQESAKDLSALDVLNMITNTNNEADNDNLLFRLESISEAFMSLLEVSAFKMGLDFPTINHRN